MISRGAFLLGAVALALLTACSAAGGDSDRPQVVAAFYPYAYVAERVAGDHAQVTNLTAPGLEPHDLELTPRQVGDITDADLMIYEAGFQPAVDQAVDQNPPRHALDVTGVVDLRDTGAPSEGDDLDGDPHVWQDPRLMIVISERFADDLAEADPAHAAAYRRNATRLVSDLRDLDRDFRRGLGHCARTEFVTSHAAFGYLAQRYGLTMVPIAGLSPDAEPSPAHLATIQDLIEADGITTVFSEVLGSKQYSETLAGDLGVTAAVLDPIEGLADEDSGDDYLSLMRHNLTALEAANGCS